MEFTNSRDFKKLAPTIAGIDKKRENLAEVIRSYPRNLDIEIVTPLREAPGISAKI